MIPMLIVGTRIRQLYQDGNIKVLQRKRLLKHSLIIKQLYLVAAVTVLSRMSGTTATGPDYRLYLYSD